MSNWNMLLNCRFCSARGAWKLGITLICLATLSLGVVAPTLAQVEGLSGWNIYLDPGHSKTENKGIYGYSEAEKNLRVGLALRDLLLSRTDIDTVYISRTNDTKSVALRDRSDEANSLGAAWFHSIHSDAGSPTANSTLMLWGQLRNGTEKTPPGGKALSDLMSPLLSRGMRTNDRGSIGDCSFYMRFQTNACAGGGPYLSVNRRTSMPSELSEAGFHTNPVQNQRNMNEQWKRLEAWTLFWSILDHHGIERPQVSIVTGIISDLETKKPTLGAEITLAGQTYKTDTYDSVFDRYSSDPNQLRNGVYFLEDVDADPGKRTVTMTVNAEGYETYVGEVQLVDTFFTFIDIELIPSFPPQVASTAPDSGDTIRVVDPIKVSFSRPMDRPSTEAAIHFEPALTGSFTWSSDYVVTFSPDSLRPVTDYTLTIGEGALGRLGDKLDGDRDGVSGGDFHVTFRTGFRDFMPPRVIASEPRQRSTGVKLKPILSLTFDEPIDSSSISASMISLARTSGGPDIPGIFEHYLRLEQSIPTFFPETELDPDTPYRFTLEPGATDEFGNEITSARNLFFTTGSASYDRTSIDTFDGDLSDWFVPQQSGSTTGILTGFTSRSVDSSFVNHLTGSISSMRVNYGWDTTRTDWLIRIFLSGGPPRAVHFDSSYSVEVYIFGDGSGTQFRFALDDRVPIAAAGNHEVSPWYSIDWTGWRLVTWRPSIDGIGSWLGDGSLDGTLRFDSIQLTYKPGAADRGTIYLDDLRIVKRTASPVAAEHEEIPGRFSLRQNYPNPFNSSTRILVELPTMTIVTLKIYDATGSEVSTLIAGSTLTSGTHEIVWRAAEEGLPSGVYFARLEANGMSRVIQMVLLR